MSLEKNITDTPLVGWKSLQVYDPGFLTTRNTVWMPHERVEAKCEHYHSEAAPSLKCTCGIYAFTRPELLRQQSYVYGIQAEVYLWGRVIECEDGYRAAYAYVKALYTHKAPTPEQEYVAYRYGVPISKLPSDHPILVPSAEELKVIQAREAKQAVRRMIAKHGRKQFVDAGKKLLMSQPAKDPSKYANAWEEVEAEAKQVAETATRQRQPRQ